jgi:hypothetical protein
MVLWLVTTLRSIPLYRQLFTKSTERVRKPLKKGVGVEINLNMSHRPDCKIILLWLFERFCYKIREMDGTSSFRKKWLYIVFWLAILIVGYLLIISFIQGFWENSKNIIIDFLVFVILLLFWMAFFAQFVLPVNTFRDRQKIFDRLITFLLGRHGPAMFIRNGEIIKREGEERKKGRGVLWLDSASAAVTRTNVKIKQTIGPGVHFIENGEYVEETGTLDLHIQSHTIGPKELEKPFEEKQEDLPQEEWNEIQHRRKQVSALTRDGIEVVPNITVLFRVDTDFPKVGQPGSRFGYRTGNRKKDKENEARDQEAIRSAILNEGIKPHAPLGSPRHRLAWNQLPALLAADIWREYAAKFTLDELFKPEQLVPPPPSSDILPTDEETDLLSQPIQVSGNRETMQDRLAKMLLEINLFIDKMIKRLEEKNQDHGTRSTTSQLVSPKPAEKKELQKKTGLQVINEMVKARLTEPEVSFLSDSGERIAGNPQRSSEYYLLKERGLKVQSVNIGSLRLNPVIDEQLIKQWAATWYLNAKTQSEQIDRERNVIEISAKEDALIKYARLLSREVNDLTKKEKPEIKSLLKALLMRSRALIRSGEYSEQLRRRMSTELQEVEDMIKWVEENGS